MYYICINPEGVPQVETFSAHEISSILSCRLMFKVRERLGWGQMQLKGWVCQRVDLVKAS